MQFAAGLEANSGLLTSENSENIFGPVKKDLEGQ